MRPAQGSGPYDGVRLSTRARASFAVGPVGEALAQLPEDGGLIAAARDVHRFLDGYPSAAGTAFGKAAGLLVRGTVHLEKTDDPDALTGDERDRLSDAVDNAEIFLAEHPRVAQSAFGMSVAELAKGIAGAIDRDQSRDARTGDGLSDVADTVDSYLNDYPQLADMPLAQAVRRLIGGVRTSAEDNPLDPDLQMLARRVGYFMQDHPRLAQSEFGQIIEPLVRGIPALGTAVPTRVGGGPAVVDLPCGDATVVVDECRTQGCGRVEPDMRNAA